MSIRKLLRFSTKAGIGGGSIYYYYELGLWKNTDEALKNYEIFKQDVNGFLDSSPALVDYLKSGRESLKANVNPVCQSVTDFRKEWLDFDVAWMKGSEGSIIKSGWNRSVGLVVDVIAASPETIKNVTVSGWTKIKELANDAGEQSSTSLNSQNPTSQPQQQSS